MPSSKGTTAHEIKANKKVMKGAPKKRRILELLGNTGSLTNNFNPSAKGCKIPKNPTTLGPFLRCIEAITFLSAKVKYATATNNGITMVKI